MHQNERRCKIQKESALLSRFLSEFSLVSNKKGKEKRIGGLDPVKKMDGS